MSVGSRLKGIAVRNWTRFLGGAFVVVFVLVLAGSAFGWSAAQKIDDMAGNSALRETLHRHFGEQMKYSGRVGLTHRSTAANEPELPGARPSWFFAPDHIRKRAKEWGPGGVEQRFGAAWSGFAPRLGTWLKVTEGRGPDAVKKVYLDTLNGHVAPDEGQILSLAS